MLRRELSGANHKRLYQLYSQARLAVRNLSSASECVPLTAASRISEVWTMDFSSDPLARDRRIKCLIVADDFMN